MIIHRHLPSLLVSLLILCSMLFFGGMTHTTFATEGNARAAFEDAIADYNGTNPDPLLKLLTLEQTAEWAVGYIGYVNRQTGRELPTQPSVALAHHVGSGNWQVILPGEENGIQYNTWLTELDDQLLSADIKERLRFPDSANQPQSITAATGYEMPWAGGWGGTLVRRHDENGNTNLNGNNYDFDLWEGSTRGTNDANVSKSGYIAAAKAGTVVYVKEISYNGCTTPACAGQANVVVIQHGPNEFSWYYHLMPYSVPNDIWPGKEVVVGTIIGQEGNTGWTKSSSGSGVHLHFMVSDQPPSTTGTETDPNYAPWPTGHIIPVGFNSGVKQISNNYPPTAYAVILYWDADYRGPAVRLTSEDAIQNCCDFQPWFNDRASSVRVYAGFSIELFEHFGRNGGWKVFSASDNNFNDDTFNNGDGTNDQVTAYELTTPNACFPPSGIQTASSCEPPPPPNDTTPPSGYFTAPANGSTINSSSVNITVSASDNSGGSGVREVRFSAKWGGTWRGIGVDSSSPYSINWDMCAADVANGDVELGMEVWDNANNKYVYSEHYSNPHVTKSYNCPADPSPPSNGQGVILYSDPNYSGYWSGPDGFTQDYANLGSFWHDNVESISIIGSYSYVLYENENYTGAHIYQSGSPNLNNQGWGNRADSIRVRNGDYNASAFTLYSLGDFNGEAWSSDRTIYDLGHWEHNDWAESMRIASGYGIVACEHDNFHGTCGRATGSGQFSDINALAQGLRHGVSSVRVCSGSCPNGASSPVLAYPADGETIAAGTTIILQWYGGGDQFRLELWGGGLGGTQTWGWNGDTQYNAGQLPTSDNPYYWKVQASNGFGDSGWIQGSFYVKPPTVKATMVFISSGALAALAAPHAKWSENPATIQSTTSFSPGDSINLFIRAQNTFASDATAYFTWKVTDPLGRAVTLLSWEGNLTTPSGIVDWYLPTTIPAYAISGNYTFEGSITYGGQTTTQSTVFSVLGPETAEAVSAYIVAGAQSAAIPQSSQPASSPSSELSVHPDSLTTNFNAGDPIELHMLVYNNASNSLIVHMKWVVIDPQGRGIGALSYEGDLETGTDLWDWWLANNIPSNAVTGDYYFLGEVTYAGRVTQVSSTFHVQGGSPSAFDDLGSAYLITSVPFSEWRDTWNTTANPQDPVVSCTGVPNSNSVWYKLIAPYTGRVAIDTFGSSYDTVVAIFSGTPGNLIEIACDDDFYGSARTSHVEFQTASGVSYYIIVMDWNTPGGGTLRFQVDSVKQVFLPLIVR